mmetsp:Transcript_33651/g.84372  ORF Transcript_33651/g.84372 Transcript_33651/m.84372 type:complete len:137 (-) Transcript_33651:599-1009(-)
MTPFIQNMMNTSTTMSATFRDQLMMMVGARKEATLPSVTTISVSQRATRNHMPTGKPITGIHSVRQSRVCLVLAMACLLTGLHNLDGVLTIIDVRVTIIQALVQVTVPMVNQAPLHREKPGPQMSLIPASHCSLPL